MSSPSATGHVNVGDLPLPPLDFQLLCSAATLPLRKMVCSSNTFSSSQLQAEYRCAHAAKALQQLLDRLTGYCHKTRAYNDYNENECAKDLDMGLLSDAAAQLSVSSTA